MVFGSGAVTTLWTTIKRAISPRQASPQNWDSESVGPPLPPDDRQPSQREWTPLPWDVTAPIQPDIDGSMIDARSPTIGPTRPRSPEMTASQDGPRDTEEDRPELGPSGIRSRFTEEAVLDKGGRQSSRNVDDGLLGYDRIGLPAQTSRCYNLAPERGAEWSVTNRDVPAMDDGTTRRTSDMPTKRISSGYRSTSERRLTDDELRSPVIRRKIILDGDSDEDRVRSSKQRSKRSTKRKLESDRTIRTDRSLSQHQVRWFSGSDDEDRRSLGPERSTPSEE